MFKVPTTNLTDFSGHNVIPQLSDGKYSESTTVYYPVAQPTDSKTGFTFHISYRVHDLPSIVQHAFFVVKVSC